MTDRITMVQLPASAVLDEKPSAEFRVGDRVRRKESAPGVWVEGTVVVAPNPDGPLIQFAGHVFGNEVTVEVDGVDGAVITDAANLVRVD